MSVSPHTRAFKELARGDCFCFGRLYFVKLAAPVIEKSSGLYAHAVELGGGEPTSFAPDDRVTHLPLARIETEGKP